MGFVHHANGKLRVAAAAPNHTPPYESTIQSKSPEYGGSSNAGDLYNDWGVKLSGLVVSEKATVVMIEREGTVDNKPCIDDPRLGFNGTHTNHNYEGPQNDRNNSFGNNTHSVGLNNGNSGFPCNGTYDHNNEGPQNDRRNNSVNGPHTSHNNDHLLKMVDLIMSAILVWDVIQWKRKVICV